MGGKFRDHFSGASDNYRATRPDYPAALFVYLIGLVPYTKLAWDCATGTGQAALSLAGHFDRVIATDASASQIENAAPHPAVEYRVSPAEHSGITGRSAGLVTVAQALHWFDLEGFYAEANRVLVDDGVLAVWCYDLVTVTPLIDEIIGHLYHEILGPWWPPQRRLVEQRYRSIPFPFRELAAPELAMHARWDFNRLAGYLRSWSAARRYRDHYRQDPVSAVEPRLRQAWGVPGQARDLAWPLAIRVGRVSHPIPS